MIYQLGSFRLNTASRVLSRNQNVVDVQSLVFDLIHLLAQQPNRAIKKADLIEAFWLDAVVSENALTRLVMKARKALGDDEAFKEVHAKAVADHEAKDDRLAQLHTASVLARYQREQQDWTQQQAVFDPVINQTRRLEAHAILIENLRALLGAAMAQQDWAVADNAMIELTMLTPNSESLPALRKQIGTMKQKNAQ